MNRLPKVPTSSVHGLPPNGPSRKSLRRPLLPAAVCFVAGTWLGLTTPVSVTQPLAAACVLVGLYLFARHHERRTPDVTTGRRVHTSFIALSAAIACGACALAAFRTGPWSSTEPLSVLDNEAGAILGVVCDDPAGRPTSGSPAIAWRFTVRTEKVRSQAGDGWLNERSEMGVYWYSFGKQLAPRYGDRWLVPGMFRVRDTGAGIGQSHYFLNGDREAARFISGRHGNAFMAWCYAKRRQAARLLEAGISRFPDQVAILHALVLGYRHAVSRELQRNFGATGTLHIFAISGLHVGMIAMLVVFVLTRCRVSRERWIFFLAPLVIVYTASTGARPSAVRACIMALLYFVAPTLNRKSDLPSALAFAALAILVVDPTQLMDTGFIFSFVVMGGLVAMCSPIERALRRFWEPDPLRLQPEPRAIVLLRAVGRRLAALIAISCSAWLASTPLTAHFFGQFIPIALVGNLVVVPLAFLIVLFGCLSLVLGACLPFAGVLINHVSVALVSVMTIAMRGIAAVPFGSMNVPRPSVWLVVAYYMLLGIVMYRVAVRRRRLQESPS